MRPAHALLAIPFVLGCAAPARTHRAPTNEPAATRPSRVVAPSGPPTADVRASSSPPPDEEHPPTEQPPLALPACNADGFGFAVESPYEMACDELMRCHGTPRFRIRNCRERGALDVRIRIAPPDHVSVATLEFAPIEPGHDATHSIHTSREGAFAVSAHFTTDDGLDAASMTTLTVTATARERARAACDACHGEWGRHGMMQIEGCLCRMPDAGHACEDARDCQGECIATGHRVVRPGHPPRRQADGTVSVAGPLAVAVGRCSEFRAVFGCHAYIPEGSRDAGPQPLRMLPRAMICRD